MNLVKTIEQFNSDCIYFCDPIKNNIMNDGNFIRILYSNNLFVLNGIYLTFTINNSTIEKYYNKYKCCFDISENSIIIENIKTIETNILKKINIKDKIPQIKITEQLRCGNIKIFSEQDENTYYNETKKNQFLLKIAGVWETDLYYGVTYKFIKL
jgi:hypothetical protein